MLRKRYKITFDDIVPHSFTFFIKIAQKLSVIELESQHQII